MRRIRSATWALATVAMLVDPAAAETVVRADDIRRDAEFRPGWSPTPSADRGDQISEVVRTMFEDRHGNLWFGTQDGLAQYDGSSLAYYDLRGPYGEAAIVSGILEDAAGTLWFGTMGGLTTYDGTSFTTFGEADGLPSQYVWCVSAARDGGLWVGTYAGACHFDGASFRTLDLPAAERTDPVFGPTSPTVVWSIAEHPSGNVWAATEGRLLRSVDGEFVSVDWADSGSEPFVRAISVDRSGHIWCGSRYSGLFRVDDDGVTAVTDGTALDEAEVGGVYEDRDGALWFAAEGFGVYRISGESFAEAFPDANVDLGVVHTTYQDRQGRMWFVGFGGAFRADGDRVVNVTRDGPW